MLNKDQETKTRERMLEATHNLRMYAGSELSGHAIELCDALSASYCLDLLHVKPEDLVRVQSALRQVSALRAVFANDGADVPKI